MHELIEMLIEKYYTCYPSLPKISCNFIITDCIRDSYLELCSILKRKLNNLRIDRLNDYNGLMVLPHSVGEPINILLNKKKMVEYTSDNSMTWLGTFAHELTHAIDYYEMAMKEKLTNYESLESNHYYMFNLWSEYHARKLGYNFLRQSLNVDNSIDEVSRIQHIKEVEWPKHVNDYWTVYHEKNDGNNQLYNTMQLLGRYSVWCDLFPKHFNESFLRIYYANAPWMVKIFTFLRQNSTLDNVYFEFREMKLILSENWTGLISFYD